MAVDNTQIQKRLRESIEAVKGGNRVRGREMLLQLVRQHGNLEQAWWWLNLAASDPQERLRALENVLRLNPGHVEAQQELTKLRQQQLAAAIPGAAPSWGQLLPEVPIEADDSIDNPYQCPYCGRATDIDDRKCAECGHSLYWRVSRSRASPSLRTLSTVVFVAAGLTVVELAGPVFGQGVAQGRTDRALLQIFLQTPGVEAFLGNFLALSAAVAERLVRILAGRAVVLVLLILGLRSRWAVAYYTAMLVLVGDLLLGVYLLVTGYLGFAAMLINLLLSMLAIVALFSSSYEFAVNDERLLVKPDSTARSGLDFFKRGHDYRKLGMWALAVAQWRRAVGLAPKVTRYYKDLGIGYAQIRRFDRSLRALEEAQRQAPDDKEIAEIIALVQAKADTDTMLKR